jgi:hypothetical protein
MHYGDKDLLDTISNSIPPVFFQDLISALKKSYQDAWEYVENNFSQPVAKDLVPHIRRAFFEDEMRDVARKHTLIARSVMNNKNNASHSEIETEIDSKKLVMTALSVQDCEDLTRLRKAQFRKSLAETSWLFDDGEFKNSGNGYYGLILHGADTENKDKLGFAHLAFPTPDCKEWFGHYNLFELAGESTQSEIIKDNADPKLRKDIIRKAE